MQYTGNVNRFIWKFGLPLLALVYCAYLVFDNRTADYHNLSEIVGQDKNNVLQKKNIKGVILGGSNAFYSLDAKLLSEKTGLNWMNLSLLSEGFSDSNYWKFIGDTLSEEQRLSIKTVIYSSITPLRKNYIKQRKKSSQDLFGEDSKYFLPSQSVLSYLKKSLLQEQEVVRYPLPTSYGDFDFSKFECKLNNDVMFNFERNLDKVDIDSWVKNQLSQLIYFFPNSTIYFVIPSEFYGKKIDASESLKSDMIIQNAIDDFNNKFHSKIIFIHQPPYPKQSMLCNDIHHANAMGRLWRTKDLYYNFVKSN